MPCAQIFPRQNNNSDPTEKLVLWSQILVTFVHVQRHHEG